MATFSAEQLNQMGAMMQKVVTESNNTLNANWEAQMKVIQEGTTQQLATMRQSTMIDVEKLVKENLQEFAKGQETHFVDFNGKLNVLSKEVEDLKSKTSGAGTNFPFLGVPTPQGRKSKRGRVDDTDPSNTGNEGFTPQDEIAMLFDRRVVVDGFMGNSSNKKRVDAVEAFLATSGTMTQYGEYKVFAKGPTGKTAIIQFADKAKAVQFIGDNLPKLKLCRIDGDAMIVDGGDVGVDAEDKSRKLFFNLNKSTASVNQQNATRFLHKMIIDKKCFGAVSVAMNKKSGQILINEFAVINIRCNKDLEMKYHIDKDNITDLQIEGLTDVKVTACVDAFKPTFQ